MDEALSSLDDSSTLDGDCVSTEGEEEGENAGQVAE